MHILENNGRELIKMIEEYYVKPRTIGVVMTHLPPKPDFTSATIQWAGDNKVFMGSYISMDQFYDWYDREIKPLFENAVEVFCNQNHGGAMREKEWSASETMLKRDATHSALLINIQKIEPESSSEDARKKELQSVIDELRRGYADLLQRLIQNNERIKKNG